MWIQRGGRLLLVMACVLLAAAVFAPSSRAQAPAGTSAPYGAAAEWTPDFSPKVRQLLSQLTLDEKISLSWGGRDPSYHGQSGYNAGVPRLGIPALRWGNGPVGMENAYELTAVPATASLASTFDPDAALRMGDLHGLESRYSGIDVVNGPDVGIVRLPFAGIGGYGEDPYLDGSIARAMVQGIQRQGVMAMPKHFIAHVNNLHNGGGATESYNFIIDDRTLHEIYLPPFEMPLKAGAASVMAAYSMVNGAYNAQNRQTLIGILRDELHWNGWVNSDWNANRSTGSIVDGLDLEMPGAGVGAVGGRQDAAPFWGPKLKAAVLSGEVPMAALDRAVGDLLTQLEIFGLLDEKRVPTPTVDFAADAAISRTVATEGAVLLKNAGVLPLRSAALGNLLLIGPTAGQLAVGLGGNRAVGFPDREISPLDALRREAGDGAHIDYTVGDSLTGVAVPSSALRADGGQSAGLSRHSGDGSPVMTDPSVDFVASNALPMGKDFRWSGTLRVPSSGLYTLQIQSWGGGAALKVNGRQRAVAATLPFGHGVPRKWTSLLPTTDGLDNGQTTMRLDADTDYSIEIEAHAWPLTPLQVRFAWITPQIRSQELDAAVAKAKQADTAVIFAWTGRGGQQAAGLGDDRRGDLPDDQNALIEAVAAANPNTIVVLNTGSALQMPWKDKVRAVLEMWYPGQEGGWATADLLLGKANPSGKLPVTFPMRLEDTPANQPGHPERNEGNPVTKQVLFSEGIFVGYRWFDEHKITPLFPFGFGLSYTSFGYSGLKAKPAASGVDIAFVLKNTGKVRGAEVAQVYVGAPARSAVPMPPKSLAGFARVELDPGQSRVVQIHIDPRQLSYWDAGHKSWRLLQGSRPVYVGSSSRDIRLTGRVAVKAT